MGNAFKKPEEFSNIDKSKKFELDKHKISFFNPDSTSSFLSNWSFRSTRSNFSVSSLKHSKTHWPRSSSITIFLSHFKLSPKEKQFENNIIIAKGAFGTVIKTTDSQCNEEHALKIIKKSFLVQENCVNQIKNEVDIHKMCGHHPFIAPFLDCWQSRYNIYILSEYVPNGELFSNICNFPFKLIKLYVAEIALAIDFLHNAGIIYRDLKPENILLSKNYHIKLIDFGLSKWLKIGNKTKTICGTLQYMAPEILREESYDHAVDWWSLGIVTCRMFTNDYPDIRKILNENDWNESKMKQNNFESNYDYDFLPYGFQNIQSEAKDLLKRLLELNPKIRLNSVLKLKRIAFFKNFNFELEAIHKIIPNEIEQEIIFDSMVPIYV